MAIICQSGHSIEASYGILKMFLFEVKYMKGQCGIAKDYTNIYVLIFEFLQIGKLIHL